MEDNDCIGSIDRLSARGFLRWTSPELIVDVIGDATRGR